MRGREGSRRKMKKKIEVKRRKKDERRTGRGGRK